MSFSVFAVLLRVLWFILRCEVVTVLKGMH